VETDWGPLSLVSTIEELLERNVSRLPFGGLEAEVSIAEKTVVTMEQ
jgi:hypothetical protein